MQREMSVTELAKFWSVSINTVWKRINKDNLELVKKPVNNREITFVIVDDDILNKYQVDNGVINAQYEEILSDDNGNKPKNADIMDKLMEYSKEINNQLIELTSVHNQQLNNLNTELITYKSQNLLLEDTSKREKQDIFELRAVNKTLELRLEKLKITLVILITAMIISSIPIGYILVKHFLQ